MSETLEQIDKRISEELFGTDYNGMTLKYARRLVAELGAQEPVGEIRIGGFDEFKIPLPHLNIGVQLPIGTELSASPVVPADWQMVPKEPTEEEIDAPRYVFQALELGLKNIQDIRLHLERCGVDISATPEWFKTNTGHLSKAGKAIVVRSLMLASAPEYKK